MNPIQQQVLMKFQLKQAVISLKRYYVFDGDDDDNFVAFFTWVFAMRTAVGKTKVNIVIVLMISDSEITNDVILEVEHLGI